MPLPDHAGSLFTGDFHSTVTLVGRPRRDGLNLFPASAFVELALYAGAQLGCEEIEELTLLSPLELSEDASIQIQVLVGEPDALGATRLRGVFPARARQ